MIHENSYPATNVISFQGVTGLLCFSTATNNHGNSISSSYERYACHNGLLVLNCKMELLIGELKRDNNSI